MPCADAFINQNVHLKKNSFLSSPWNLSQRHQKVFSTHVFLSENKKNNYSTTDRLREEIEAPFAKVRVFGYSVLLAGCILSLLISLARIAAGLNGINTDVLQESINNAAIDVGGVFLLSFLLKSDFDAKESRLKRAAKGAEIANLQVKGPFGPDQRIETVPLSAFRSGRGIDKRIVICVASKETIHQLLNDIESSSSLQEDLVLSDLVVVPWITPDFTSLNQANSQAMQFDCIGIPVGLNWNDFLRDEIKEAEKQGVDVNGRGFSIVLKKNGRVGQRTKGINLERMVGDVNARKSSGMDVRNI
jgi:hypothetical protein